MDAKSVRSALKLEDERAVAWIADLEKLGPPPEPVRLPRGDEARELLRRLEVPEVDIEEIVASAPDPERDPELWWLLERVHHATIQNMGDCRVKRRGAPPLPGQPFFYVHVFLATVPATRRFHESRGIPEETTWETLGHLGELLTVYRRKHGEGGMNQQWWTTFLLCGIVYRLGRLQFSLSVSSDGTPELGMHIPEGGGPLIFDIFYESMRRARPFFDKHFPEHGAEVATGTSWLLDPQLEEYLPEDSRILMLRKAWTRTDAPPLPGDEAILEFIFRYNGQPLDELPQRSSLERAIVTHLKAGRHWHEYSGWTKLP